MTQSGVLVENRKKESLHNILYSGLLQIVREKGLMDDPHDKSFYAHCAVTFSFALLCLYLAVYAVSGFLSACAIGALAGILSGWIGMLGHDAGHGQAQKHNKGMRKLLQLFLGNISLGFSSEWWIDKHTNHHRFPNQMGKDPDIVLPLPLSAAQARERNMDASRFRVKNAWWIFWLLLPLQAANARISSIRYLKTAGLKPMELLAQVAGITVYFALYGALAATIGISEGWLLAMTFVVVHQGAHGFYNSLVFATNHKGMPQNQSWETPTFLELQILTSRNVKSGSGAFEVLITWLYGGLNYQIEHHLFPKMPRCNLKRVRPLVKEFCRENGFDYYETGIRRSYWEVLQNFKQVARELTDSPMGA